MFLGSCCCRSRDVARSVVKISRCLPSLLKKRILWVLKRYIDTLIKLRDGETVQNWSWLRWLLEKFIINRILRVPSRCFINLPLLWRKVSIKIVLSKILFLFLILWVNVLSPKIFYAAFNFLICHDRRSLWSALVKFLSNLWYKDFSGIQLELWCFDNLPHALCRMQIGWGLFRNLERLLLPLNPSLLFSMCQGYCIVLGRISQGWYRSSSSLFLSFRYGRF